MATSRTAALLFVVLSRILVPSKQDGGSYSFINPIHFPYSPTMGPYMGMILALQTPLEDPNEHSIFFAYNFEASYNLPTNQSYFSYPPLVTKRSWDRQFFYDILEYKIQSSGIPGKACLLRTICEASLHSLESATGVLGDVFHIILTPSSSINNQTSDSYENAELYGKTKRHCKKYTKGCSVSLLDLVSLIGKLLFTKQQ